MSALIPPMITMATQGVRKRFSLEKATGHTPWRPRVKASRVALSIAVLIEVSVAMIPATAMNGTPQPGMKRCTASVSAVSVLASSCQGTTPSVTMPTARYTTMVAVRLMRIPRGILRLGLLTSSASSAITSKPT